MWKQSNKEGYRRLTEASSSKHHRRNRDRAHCGTGPQNLWASLWARGKGARRRREEKWRRVGQARKPLGRKEVAVTCFGKPECTSRVGKHHPQEHPALFT